MRTIKKSNVGSLIFSRGIAKFTASLATDILYPWDKAVIIVNMDNSLCTRGVAMYTFRLLRRCEVFDYVTDRKVFLNDFEMYKEVGPSACKAHGMETIQSTI